MSAWTSKPPQQLAAWRQLNAVATRQRQAALPALDAERVARFSQRLGPLWVVCARQRVDEESRRLLLALAEESGLETAIQDLFAGHHVNVTEDRPALHMALRTPARQDDGLAPTAQAEARQTRQRMMALAEAVRSGRWRGVGGKPMATVLHIGIGGSHLGPALAVEALGGDGPNIRFLANVDGAATSAALAGLDPATTLAVVVSKSFGTEETLANAATVRSWFLERTCDPAAVAKHFVAVTANTEAAAAFGIPPAQCLPLPEWVGGRFSLWSAVGLPLAIAIGQAGFDELLAGAGEVDAHFRATPLAGNLPVLLALLQVWNQNFLGCATHAVLPYDHRLRLLPDYLQQLEMESNGKSVRVDGEASAIDTVPVIWGGEGTNGQHAFHQWLHQGTRSANVDFITCARPSHGLAHHHDALLAHCFAQGQALWEGRSAESRHRNVPGGRASTTILLDELTPRALGALLALYEHKVFCASTIWQINAFDQWGVEVGKQLAAPIREALGGASDGVSDPLTNNLVGEVRRLRAAQRAKMPPHRGT